MPLGKGKGNRTGSDTTPKFSTVEDFQKALDAYFADCDKKKKLYSIPGLCLFLKTQQQTFATWYNGEKRAELQDATRMACLRIQEQVETDARYQEKGMVTRGIFLNKQMMLGGYQDRIEAKQDIAVNVKMGKGMDDSDFK